MFYRGCSGGWRWGCASGLQSGWRWRSCLLSAHPRPTPVPLRLLTTELPVPSRASWSQFTNENLVNEANMMEMANALVSSGMAQAGYDTVNGKHVFL